jgi:hypothetical protein
MYVSSVLQCMCPLKLGGGRRWGGFKAELLGFVAYRRYLYQHLLIQPTAGDGGQIKAVLLGGAFQTQLTYADVC